MSRALSSRRLPARLPAKAVRQCAYYLWVQQGRPAGRALDLWLTAQECVRHPAEPRRTRYRPPRRRTLV